MEQAGNAMSAREAFTHKASRDYRDINRRGWAELAAANSTSSRPFASEDLRHARTMLDPNRAIPWEEVRSVLCLAAAGGQQALLFAALGYEVVSVDLSPAQLRIDQDAALQHGLAIECLEGDMMDLSAVYHCRFDLVFQAVSACYVPDVRRVYREVAKVLRPRGLYRVEHWNPFHLQLSDEETWTGRGYQLATPHVQALAIPWYSPGASEATCVHFVHTMGDLLQGLCEAGFSMIAFDDATFPGRLDAPPGSQAHIAAYIPPFFTILSRLAETSGHAR
jgi:SAM-dependent methyltransferase